MQKQDRIWKKKKNILCASLKLKKKIEFAKKKLSTLPFPAQIFIFLQPKRELHLRLN